MSIHGFHSQSDPIDCVRLSQPVAVMINDFQFAE